MDRRSFIRGTGMAGLSVMLPGISLSNSRSKPVRYRLNKEGKPPVIIKQVDLYRVGNDYLVKVISENGSSGQIPANSKIEYMTDMFTKLIVPFFLNKNGWEIEDLVDEVYRVNSNYKYAGMPFWFCVAHVELAVLDMLARLEELPVGALFGKQIRKSFPVYFSTFDRQNIAEVYLENVRKNIGQFRAVKLKIGGRMSDNRDCIEGRTEKMIPLFRKALGDDFTIYVDANSSYGPEKAIEVGRLMEKYNYGFFEEPCPWQDYEATKKVTEALGMPVAGGEQDSSFSQFKYMIDRNVLDIIQPDIMYNGGFTRTLRIAELCNNAGLPVTLHSPQTGAANAFKMQFVSIVDKIGDFQEYNGGGGYNWCEIPLQFNEGQMKIVNDPGWGIRYEENYLNEAKKIN